MFIQHREYFPAFGLGSSVVCRLTVLSVNEVAGDCAAYEGITPDTSADGDGGARSKAVLNAVKKNGNKIREDRARILFPEITEMNLTYRK